MAGKKSAAAGAVAVAQAARSNPYVQRLIEDAGLRNDLRDGIGAARKAYGRLSNGKAPGKALIGDKKLQRELKQAAESLKSASDSLRGPKRSTKRLGRAVLVALVLGGAGAAIALNEDLRKKVLDGLFGSEEEFEYASTTTPDQPKTVAKA